jgi:NADP-dependent 3-hydroxy acid dehydrogenase YdfG
LASEGEDEFHGRVVIITGSASFLGDAVAAELVAAGASVVLGDRDADHGTAAAARLGDRARFVQTDMTQDADLDRLISIALPTSRTDCSIARVPSGARSSTRTCRPRRCSRRKRRR